jgi:hypothetical protein
MEMQKIVVHKQSCLELQSGELHVAAKEMDVPGGRSFFFDAKAQYSFLQRGDTLLWLSRPFLSHGGVGAEAVYAGKLRKEADEVKGSSENVSTWVYLAGGLVWTTLLFLFACWCGGVKLF